ncbi:hypothetical protein AYI68_g7883 [Smittium mucronatum]|uniref:Uncharacterized protein n=1 Tax=Smittium mucronatum TaxID=133383 RepID=A0A1R0GMI4_9FUNG|nr:hypothetical protein AYI68_g7883 [Smittium mucronatum]
MFNSIKKNQDNESVCDSIDSRFIDTAGEDHPQKDYLACFETEFIQIKSKLDRIHSVLNGEINQIHNNLIDFNKNFGFYLNGLKLYSQQVEFPEEPNEATMELIARGKLDISNRESGYLDYEQRGREHNMLGSDEQQFLESSIADPSLDYEENEGIYSSQVSDPGYENFGDQDEYTMVEPLRSKPAAQKRSDSTPGPFQRPPAASDTKSRSSIGGPGRQSGNNSQRSKRKQVLNIKRYTDILPNKYRSQPHRGIVEAILKELSLFPEGKQQHELMRDIGGLVGGVLSKSKWSEYLTMLEKNEILLKIKNKGFVYMINDQLQI